MENLAHVKKLRESAETARVGLKWSDEESERLLDAFRSAPAIDDQFIRACALAHGRTPEGIRAHVEAVAVRALDDNATIESVCAMTGLPMEQVLAALEAHNKARYARALRKIRKTLARFAVEDRARMMVELNAPMP